MCEFVSIKKGQSEEIPLESVKVKVLLTHGVARAKISQLFVNKRDHPIETFYRFPVIDYNHMIDCIRARIGLDREEKFDHDPELIRIGWVDPGVKIEIIIDLIMSIDEKDDQLKLHIHKNVLPSLPQCLQQSSIHVQIVLQGKINRIESPTHQIQIRIDPNWTTWTHGVVEASGLDKDFVLLISPARIHVPRLYAEKSQNSVALLLHCTPKIEVKQQKIEALFIVDPTLTGNFYELAKSTLQSLIQALPFDCYFNIGSNAKSDKYNTDSLTKAMDMIDSDQGGIQFKDFQETLQMPSINGYLRTVFVLSSGELPGPLIQLCRANSLNYRVFVLKIRAKGDDVQSIVSQMMDDATRPCLTDVRVEWKGVEGSKDRVEPIPSGSPLIIVKSFPLDKVPVGVGIYANTPHGKIYFDIAVMESSYSDMTEDLIHKFVRLKSNLSGGLH